MTRADTGSEPAAQRTISGWSQLSWIRRQFSRAGRGLRRLLNPQSALTMHDLLNLACIGDAHRAHSVLERIYEWYFSRTTTAIRVSYGAAVGLSVALYNLAMKDNVSTRLEHLGRGLAVAAAVCIVAGVLQRRELAQLHREAAAASRLLSELSALPAKYLRPARKPAGDHSMRPTALSEGSLLAWGTTGVIAIILIGGLLAALALGAFHNSTPLLALAVVAVVTILSALPHLVAENWPRSRAEPLSLDDVETLHQAIGHLRLDAYILDPTVTERVEHALREPKFFLGPGVEPPGRAADHETPDDARAAL